MPECSGKEAGGLNIHLRLHDVWDAVAGMYKHSVIKVMGCGLIVKKVRLRGEAMHKCASRVTDSDAGNEKNMLSIEEKQKIRDLYYRKGIESIVEIARITGHNRKTVTKYVDMKDSDESLKSANGGRH